jgi:hypothetical protein
MTQTNGVVDVVEKLHPGSFIINISDGGCIQGVILSTLDSDLFGQLLPSSFS